MPRASSPRRRVLFHRGSATTAAGAFALRREEFRCEECRFISLLTASIAEQGEAPAAQDAMGKDEYDGQGVESVAAWSLIDRARSPRPETLS